jgi:hypothetical protein
MESENLEIPKASNAETTVAVQPPDKPIIKSKLLFKVREDHYKEQVRKEYMKKIRGANAILNKTIQEINRANNAIYLGRLTKMKRHELDSWENYVDRMMNKEKRIREDLHKYEKTMSLCNDRIYIHGLLDKI